MTHTRCGTVIDCVVNQSNENDENLKLFMQRNTPSSSTTRTTEAPLIYAVDDVPDLTELYTTFLEATGHIVRAFNDRSEALAALKADRTKPDLLITDYL